MRNVTVTVPEDEAQMILRALAASAIENPGWDYYLRQIANRFASNAEEIFDGFKEVLG